MPRQTFQQVIAEVQRMPGMSRISLGEIIDNIGQAAKDIGNEPMPWNYAETNVLVPAPYSTGTIDIATGTGAVTGNGVDWTPYIGQIGWRIRFGNGNLDYIISSVNTATFISLAQPVNLSASLVAATYTLYKDTYEYPTDYIFGSDVGLFQPTIRRRVNKIPRYKFEQSMNSGLRSFSTNMQMFYCDQGQTTFGTFQFRLGPPPAGPAELRLCYHQITPSLVLSSDLIMLPEGYDEIVSLMAASRIYDIHKKPGESDRVKALAAGKIRLLKRQVASQTIDDMPVASTETSDSSISQFGMMISRP